MSDSSSEFSVEQQAEQFAEQADAETVEALRENASTAEVPDDGDVEDLREDGAIAAALADELEFRLNVLRMPEAKAVQNLKSEFNVAVPNGDTVADVKSMDAPSGDADNWVNMCVEVLELWEAEHEEVQSVGLIGDDTGTIRFTAFQDADLPELVEGETYNFSSIVQDIYQDRVSVKVVPTSDVEAIDADIDVPDPTVTVDGTLTDSRGASGLIERCGHDDCTRVASDGECPEHGSVDTEDELRLKLVLNIGGGEAYAAIFDTEMTEALTGISLEEAIESKEESMGYEQPSREVHQAALGSTGEFVGTVYENDDSLDTLLVTEFEPAQELTAEDVDEALVEVRA